MIEESVFSDATACAEAAAQAMADALRVALAARGTATLGVSGGRIPRVIYPLLARKSLDWGRVTAALIDERWVAATDAESNEALVRDCLLRDEAAAAGFVGMKTPYDDPDSGHAACEAAYARVQLPFDVVHLGFGPDGHVASLFPGRDDWEAASGCCVPVPAAEGGLARMSLTSAALLNSRLIIVVYDGAEKHAVFQAARTDGPVRDLPLRLILRQDAVPVAVFSAP